MGYAGYLRDKSRECIGLAVAEPWSQDVGSLIDLALDYSRWARGVEEPQPERAAELTDTCRGVGAMPATLAIG